MPNDNQFGQMAQEALAGVNGGASALAPATGPEPPNPPGDSEASPRPLPPVAPSATPPNDDALTVAMGALNRLSRGAGVLPREGVGGLGGGTLSEIMERVKASRAPAQPPGMEPPNPPGGSGATPTSVAPAPVGGAYARLLGVTQTGGARPRASYAYGKVRVALPDGLDLNDDNAVRSAIEERNRQIDTMNSLYEEED